MALSDQRVAFGDLGNAAFTVFVAPELHHHIDYAGRIGDRVAAREADSRLHDHQRKLLQRAAQRVRVDGRETARMAGVDRAQEADALGAAQFPEHDAVGT